MKHRSRLRPLKVLSLATPDTCPCSCALYIVCVWASCTPWRLLSVVRCLRVGVLHALASVVRCAMFACGRPALLGVCCPLCDVCVWASCTPWCLLSVVRCLRVGVLHSLVSVVRCAMFACGRPALLGVCCPLCDVCVWASCTPWCLLSVVRCLRVGVLHSLASVVRCAMFACGRPALLGVCCPLCDVCVWASCTPWCLLSVVRCLSDYRCFTFTM